MTKPDRESLCGYVHLAPDEPAPHKAPLKTYDAQPLFPRDDDSPEDAGIRFVTLIRRTPVTPSSVEVARG